MKFAHPVLLSTSRKSGSYQHFQLKQIIKLFKRSDCNILFICCKAVRLSALVAAQKFHNLRERRRKRITRILNGVDTISLSVLIVALVLALSTPVAFAQTATSVTQVSAGTQHFQGYDGNREDINLGTGSLHIGIPLISLPQRGGHNLDIGIEYDSQNFNLEILQTPPSGSVTFWNVAERNMALDASQLDWRLTLPYLSSTTVNSDIIPGNSYQYNSNYVLTLPDGSTHQFLNNVGACVGSSAPCGTSNSTMQSYSPDYDTVYLDTSSPTTAVAITRDGTRYTFPIWGGSCYLH